jgi:hypothetical protein
MIRQIAIGIIMSLNTKVRAGAIELPPSPPPLKREVSSDYCSDNDKPRGIVSKYHYLYGGGGEVGKKNNTLRTSKSESVDLAVIIPPQNIDIVHSQKCTCSKCSWRGWCCSLFSRKK